MARGAAAAFPGNAVAANGGPGGRRLLIPMASRYLGGAELHTAALARHLAEHGFAVLGALDRSVCAPELVERFVIPKLACCEATIAWDPDLPAADNRRRQRAGLVDLLRRHPVDAVLLPVSWPRHATGLLEGTARCRLPTLVLFHQAPERAALAPEERAALDLAVHRPVAVSEDLAERVRVLYGLSYGAVLVVPNAVPAPEPLGCREHRRLRRRVRRSFGIAPDAPLVLTVARFAESKGYDDLLRVAARLVPREPDLHFLCIGDGPGRPVLLARLRERGLARRVHCPGSFRDVTPFYRAADVFFLPTRREGHSLSMTEAAAFGLPLVTTTVSGQDRMLAGTGAAILVPPGAVAEMSAALLRLLRDEDLAARMGKSAAIWASGAAVRDMHAHYGWLMEWILTGQKYRRLVNQR